MIKNKVLPLLEEYFYNDWQKIRLVLGDNQKQDPALCFIRSIKNEGNIQRLFGTDASDDLQEEESAITLQAKTILSGIMPSPGVRFTMQVREARRTTNDRAAAVVHL